VYVVGDTRHSEPARFDEHHVFGQHTEARKHALQRRRGFPGAALAKQQHRAVAKPHAGRVQRQHGLVALDQREDRELQ
jgi:hypothetical protein